MAAGIGLHFTSASAWEFHAFYTGLVLLVAGQALEHLVAIRSLNDVLVEDLRRGVFQEHIVNIRSLLDGLHALARKQLGLAPHAG